MNGIEAFMMSARRSFIVALTIASSSTACEPSDETSAGAVSTGAACEDSGENANGSIDVAGSVIFHSMNKLASGRTGQSIDYSGLVVGVVDLNGLSSGAPAAPLAEASLSAEGCASPTAASCVFCFIDANIAGSSAGLGVAVRDGRTSDPLWITAVRGVASSDRLAELQTSGAPLDNASPFAVTRDALDAVVASLTGLSGDELMQRGVLFGLIYSNTLSSGERGEPVAGATVTASDGDVTIVYPSSNFSGVGSATANQGAFLAVPNAPGAAATATFTVTPPSSASQTWDATQTGLFVPDAMYFHVMYAAE